jgi:hypothetical protein
VVRYRAALASTRVGGQPLLAAMLWGPNGTRERRAVLAALRSAAPELDLDLDARVTGALANSETLWAASNAIEAILVEHAPHERGGRRWRRWRRAVCCLDPGI